MTQRLLIVPLSSVPITAGPTVPIVNLDGATLSAIAGKRWQVVLYLDNNSADPVLPVIKCRFTDAGKQVEQTGHLRGDVALTQDRVAAVDRDCGTGDEI